MCASRWGFLSPLMWEGDLRVPVTSGLRGCGTGCPCPRCVVLCALARSVREYPRLGVLALPWHLEPSATFPLASTI